MENPLYKDAIKGARFPTPLCMAQGGHSCVQSQSVTQNVFHVFGADRVKSLVMRPLSDDNYSGPFTDFTMLDAESGMSSTENVRGPYAANLITHLILPWICVGWSFGNEDEISASTATRISLEMVPTLLAPHLIPARRANQPQCLPITSRTKALE